MSLFVDKWSSPFDNPFGLGDFYTTSFGEFRLGSNTSLFGNNSEKKENNQPSDMKLKNGSVLTERGFYDHFDSIFHDRSRRYDLRAAASDSSRLSPKSTGKGKEYIIPIRMETTPKGENSSKNSGKEPTPSAAAHSSSVADCSSTGVIQIPIVRETSGQTSKHSRDKSRSPVLSESSKAAPTSSTFRLLTPTTELNRRAQKRDTTNDVVLDSDAFFVRSHATPGQNRPSEQKSDIEVVEIEAEDSFVKSLGRKPLRHFHNTSSVSSQSPVVGSSIKVTADSTKILFTSKDDVDRVQDASSRTQKEKESKRSVCCHSGPTDIAPTPSYPIYDYLKPELFTQGRQMDYIRGDGNCFFRAVSKDVYGSEDYHQEWRHAVCDLIQNHPDVFRQYIDDSSINAHVTDMRLQGTWATTCEIYAAATLLEREIYVLAPSPSSNAEYHWLLFSPRAVSGSAIGGGAGQEGEGGKQGCYVTLCHTNANHYDRITPISARCNCQLPPPSLNGVSMVLDLTGSDEEELMRRE